jgi:hypothetical protein
MEFLMGFATPLAILLVATIAAGLINDHTKIGASLED